MRIRIRAFEGPDQEAWDGLVAQASAGTFLHSRRFLSYHAQRFTDCSLVLEDDSDAMQGVFPAAFDPSDPAIVVSHPGSTYGGLLHTGGLQGEQGLHALEAICSRYRQQGRRLLRYKCVPSIYHRMPAQDDAYALFRMNARLYRRDLSCAIDLAARGNPSGQRRRGLKKARSSALKVSADFEAVRRFWPVLEDNLAARHRVTPVHTIEEIALLRARLPSHIDLLVATLDEAVVAGVLLFDSDRVSHAQYIAASDQGRQVGALEAVFETAIERAAQAGRRYFDFGISTEQGGAVLNDGLYSFKAGFGGSGVVHDFYEITLE